jgi:hypothetical protein
LSVEPVRPVGVSPQSRNAIAARLHETRLRRSENNKVLTIFINFYLCSSAFARPVLFFMDFGFICVPFYSQVSSFQMQSLRACMKRGFAALKTRNS